MKKKIETHSNLQTIDVVRDLEALLDETDSDVLFYELHLYVEKLKRKFEKDTHFLAVDFLKKK